jgi:hypothetical protein
VINLVLSVTNSANSQNSYELTDFKINVGYENNQLTLQCEYGCAWTNLKFTLREQDSPQFINETGLTSNIIDTTTINGLTLYVVESIPEPSGIRYFYYADNKIYNYNANLNLLELLYDFTETEDYYTDYRPICDPSFPHDSLLFKQYH